MLSGTRPINPTVGGTSAGGRDRHVGVHSRDRRRQHAGATSCVRTCSSASRYGKPLGTQTDACCCVQLTALLLPCQPFASCTSSSSAGRIADSLTGEMSTAQSLPPQIRRHGFSMNPSRPEGRKQPPDTPLSSVTAHIQNGLEERQRCYRRPPLPRKVSRLLP